MNKHQIWEITLNRLQERVSSPIFTTWFSNTVALSFHEGIFVVGVQTTFAKAHLEARYLDVIRTTVSEVAETPLDVQFAVSHERLLASDRLPLPINPAFQESEIGKFLLLITQEESGYRASVPDVPGCVAVGNTQEEAVHAVREALQAYLVMMDNDHEALPEPRTTAEYVLFPLAFSQKEGSIRTQKDFLFSREDIAHCSFCGTQPAQMSSLTAGPGGLHICQECVAYCREMLLEQGTIDFSRLREALAPRQQELLP